jgi:hypothetical protein
MGQWSISRVKVLCSAAIIAVVGLTSDAVAALTTSFVSEGAVSAEVAAFASAGGSSTSGVLTLTRVPAGATIEQAWLYGDDGLGTGIPVASFNGVVLGPGIFLGSNTHHRTFRWDVTALIAGNGTYQASASGFGTNYGLGLVVAFRHSSLPTGQVVINDGAGELAHGTTFSESTIFNAPAGPATLWLYTNGDDPGPPPVTGEEILFNGTVVGGPIDANLGLRASLFAIPVSATGGPNTLEIRTPVSGSADNFNWPVAVLVVGMVMPGCDGPSPGVPWKNHGAFVSAVVHNAEALLAAGIITEEEKDSFVSESARSDCGKKR